MRFHILSRWFWSFAFGIVLSVSSLASVPNTKELSELSLRTLTLKAMMNAEGTRLDLRQDGAKWSMTLRSPAPGAPLAEYDLIQENDPRFVVLKEVEGRFSLLIGPSDEGLIVRGEEFVSQNRLLNPNPGHDVSRKVRANFFLPLKTLVNLSSLKERHDLAYEALVQWYLDILEAIGANDWSMLALGPTLI